MLKEMKTAETQRERTKVWQSGEFGNLEGLRANYVTHSFARHTHEGFAIGAIERGVDVFNYRGKKHEAGKGGIILINPAEVHDGCGKDKEGWAFSILYADPQILHRAARENAGKNVMMPFFDEAVVSDEYMFRNLVQLHRVLESSASTLERESLILTTFAELVSRHARNHSGPVTVNSEPRAVSRVKSYLEENYSDDVSLKDIAAFASMSRYHLIRVFKKHTGLPPHAYLEQIRIERAKQLLGDGMTIAETACQLGFVDQSHLTKTFKRYAGATPGQYVQRFNVPAR